MILKEHQTTAVDELVSQTRILLATQNSDMKYVFKSPTGSGKTVMMGELLKRLATETKAADENVFVWASLYDLHEQSRAKLSEYLGHHYNLIGLEDLHGGEPLPAKTILFVNWHSLVKKKKNKTTGEDEWANLYVRDSEHGRNVPRIFAATRAAGRGVIMVVDESHTNYYGARAQEFIADHFQPRLTFEVSATPETRLDVEDLSDKRGAFTKVDFESVVESGLIRSETEVNAEIGRYVDLADQADGVVLEAALAKRKQLAALNTKLGIPVNPLILVQLPSDAKAATALDKTVREETEKVLKKHGITYDNGKLAVWLANDKRNKDGVEDAQSPVEVLIFKQAVAVGWDCPRAQILVMLREMKSLVFEIQTVGRILRMPEAKHYDEEEELNKAFVYTNIPRFTVDPTPEALSYFKTQKAKLKQALLKEGIASIQLPNYYATRAGEYGDLTREFSDTLYKYLSDACGFTRRDDAATRCAKAGKKLELDPAVLAEPIVADAVVRDWDRASDINKLDYDQIQIAASNGWIEKVFDDLAKRWSTGYVKERSYDKVKTGLYEWFNDLGLTKQADVRRIVACSEQNQSFITSIVVKAKEHYQNKIERAAKEKQRKQSQAQVGQLVFTLPTEDYFNENYEPFKAARYTHEPCLLQKARKETEKAFIKLLDNSDKVEWWYNNGVNQKRYLAIEYHKDDDTGHSKSASFYPDFIVRFTDGTIGIYDTKSGLTTKDEDTKKKSEYLQDYVATRRAEGISIEGGIVDVTDAKKQNPKFRICYERTYEPPTKSPAKWEAFARC